MGTKISNIDQLIDELSEEARFLMIQRGSNGAFATKTCTIQKLMDILSGAWMDSPEFTGVPKAPMPTDASPTTQIATKGYVAEAVANVDASIKWSSSQLRTTLVWVEDKACLDSLGNLYTATRNEIVYISANWKNSSDNDTLTVVIKPEGGNAITLMKVEKATSECKFACPVIINKGDALYLIRNNTTTTDSTYVEFVSFEFKGIRSDLESSSGGGGTGAVTRIIAGANVTVTPSSGTGEVTISTTGGGGGGGGGSAREQYCDGTWRFLQGVTEITDSMFGPAGQSSKAYYWRQHGCSPDWTGQRGIIAEDLLKINDFGLYNATFLSKLYMPKLEEIGKYGFYDCEHLNGTLTLESLKYIGEYCFYSCNGAIGHYEPNFTAVYFPKFKSGGYRSLEACSYMQSINLGHGKDASGNYVVELGDSTMLDSLIMDTEKIKPRGAPEQTAIIRAEFPNIERELNTLDIRHLDNTANLKTINCPRSQVLMDYCFRSAYSCNTVDLRSVIWAGYQALLYLGHTVAGGLTQLDMRSLRYAGVYSMQYINTPYLRLDNLLRIGYEAFYSNTEHTVHFYAPNLKRIDYYGLGLNRKLVNSQYLNDEGNIVGEADVLSFPELTHIVQGGLYDCRSVLKLKIPKAKVMGADALGLLINCTDIWLDDSSNYTADELVSRQLNNTLDDYGLYYVISSYRDNKTIHCKNGETLKWDTVTGRWKKVV